MTESNVEQATNAQADSVVTLTDLQNVLVVIDLASNRGAFRGPELQPVGALYEKINRFLQSVIPQTAPEAAEGADAESTTAETETDSEETA